MAKEKAIKHKAMSKNKRKDLLIYILFMIWPTLQFVIFYIGVNFGSFSLAFQRFDIETLKYVYNEHALETFKAAFRYLFVDNKSYLIGSLTSFLLTFVIGCPLGLFFSYYIYKKLPLSGFFKVVLFLPSILSAIVTVTLFKYFLEFTLPAMMKNWFHVANPVYLLQNKDTIYGTVMFYSVWSSFGTTILMYSNTMSSINPELIEAANIDGATGFKEFWHVIMPKIYPTFTIFLISGIASIFVNQYNVYSFFGFEGNENVKNFGYLFFRDSTSDNDRILPTLAAVGLIISFIIIPVTLLIRKLLKKVGPSEE